LRALELHRREAVDRAVAAIAVQPLAGRADAGLLRQVEQEVFRLEFVVLLWRRAVFVLQWIGLRIVRSLSGIAFFPPAMLISTQN